MANNIARDLNDLGVLCGRQQESEPGLEMTVAICQVGFEAREAPIRPIS